MCSCFTMHDKPRSTKFKVIKWILIFLKVFWLIDTIAFDFNELKAIQEDIQPLKHIKMLDTNERTSLLVLHCIWALLVIIVLYLENLIATTILVLLSMCTIIFFNVYNMLRHTNRSSNQVIDDFWRFGLTIYYASLILLEGGSACTFLCCDI